MATDVEEPMKQQESEAIVLSDMVQGIKITDSDSMKLAESFLKDVVLKRKQWADMIGPVKKSAHESHAAACKLESKVDTPLAQGESYLRKAIVAYKDEEEKNRLAEEVRRQKEEDRKAQLEAKAKAEEDALEAAIEAEDNGDNATAEAILQSPVRPAPYYAPPVIVPSTTVHMQGISGRSNWKVRRITNIDLVPNEFKIPASANFSLLNAYAKKMREHSEIPGVEFFNDSGLNVKL